MHLIFRLALRSIILFYTSTTIAQTLILDTGKQEKINPLWQQPGQNHDALNMTHPPIFSLNKKWLWECNICQTLPTLLTKKISRRKAVYFSEWQLKKNLKWSNGSTINGYDVKRTLNLLRPHLPTINQSIKSITIDPDDPKKFTVVFRTKFHDFYKFFAIRLLPKEVTWNISYGPYKIDSWPERGPILSRNPYFSEPNIGSFERISFQKLTEKKKDEHPFLKISNDHDKRRPSEKFESTISTNLKVIALNLRNPLFNNQKLRSHLSDVIDRSLLNKTFFNEDGHPTDSFMHPADPICLPHLGTQSVEGSRAIWTGKKIRIELVYRESKKQKALAEFIKNSWAAAGIEVALKGVSKIFFDTRVLKEAHFSDAVLLDWHIAPGTFPYNVFHSKDIPSFENSYRGMNISGWINRYVDRHLVNLKKCL